MCSSAERWKEEEANEKKKRKRMKKEDVFSSRNSPKQSLDVLLVEFQNLLAHVNCLLIFVQF
jgi:hypothetical protein